MFNSFKSLIISILLLSNIAYSKDMQKIVFSEWDKPEINIFYNLLAYYIYLFACLYNNTRLYGNLPVRVYANMCLYDYEHVYICIYN